MLTKLREASQTARASGQWHSDQWWQQRGWRVGKDGTDASGMFVPLQVSGVLSIMKW